MILLKIIGSIAMFFLVTFYLVFVVTCGVSAGLRNFFKNHKEGK